MAVSVITVVTGGRPVIDVTATAPKLGMAVTEALNGKGMPVTKVVAYGVPVSYLVIATNGDKHPK
jgi:hypothetical protein